MKEKIREILVDDNCNCLLCKRESAEEITAMVMEFVEWLLLGNDGTFIQSHKEYHGKYAGMLIHLDDFNKEHTLNDIFNYWLTNIYKK